MESNENYAALAHEVATTIAREGNVQAVFGAPLKLETKTIVPVASIAIGGGAGGVRALGAAVHTLRRWLTRGTTHTTPSTTLAGGAGGGIDVRPIGFLSEENGRVVFTRIDDGKGRPPSRRADA